MNEYRKYFVKAIRVNYPEKFADIISKVNTHYNYISKDTKFAFTSKNPLDKRLDFSSYFLALIKALDEQGENFERIRSVCLEVVTAYVQPKNKAHAFFKRLIPKFINTWIAQPGLKLLSKKVNQNKNADGFIANIITDKQQTFGLGYGVDILECGICKLFQKHNYSRYASILCEVDKITSNLAGLNLIRTGTIANGADKCDFRFKRKSD